MLHFYFIRDSSTHIQVQYLLLGTWKRYKKIISKQVQTKKFKDQSVFLEFMCMEQHNVEINNTNSLLRQSFNVCLQLSSCNNLAKWLFKFSDICRTTDWHKSKYGMLASSCHTQHFSCYEYYWLFLSNWVCIFNIFGKGNRKSRLCR